MITERVENNFILQNLESGFYQNEYQNVFIVSDYVNVFYVHSIELLNTILDVSDEYVKHFKDICLIPGEVNNWEIVQTSLILNTFCKSIKYLQFKLQSNIKNMLKDLPTNNLNMFKNHKIYSKEYKSMAFLKIIVPNKKRRNWHNAAAEAVAFYSEFERLVDFYENFDITTEKPTEWKEWVSISIN